MNRPKPRYYFQFILKVNWDGAELRFNKIAPILNQLGIEDSSRLEEAVRFFYENLDWNFDEPLMFLSKLNFIIWRRQAHYSLFVLRPFFLESLLKFWIDGGFKNSNGFFFLRRRRKLLRKYRRYFGLSMSRLCSLSWNSEFGYRNNLRKGLNSLSDISGTFYSYAKRKEMLGRKINFRRKVKKKGLEEF